jgi:hypothetical protein
MTFCISIIPPMLILVYVGEISSGGGTNFRVVSPTASLDNFRNQREHILGLILDPETDIE